MLRDLRLALRSLLKRPGFNSVIIITLALGIGANTAIFSVVNTVLLAPLPYQDPARLVAVWAKNDQKGLTNQPVSYLTYLDWKEQNQVFDHLAAIRPEAFSLLDKGEPERVNGLRVTVNILPLLGAQPARGRDFLPEEGQPEKASVALISHGLWQRRYGGDPKLIGQTLTLDAKPYTVIGILPPGLKYPGLQLPPTGADVWIPFIVVPSQNTRGFANLRLVGRLKPGVTLERAQSEMDLIARRLEQQYPTDHTNLGIQVVPLQEQLVGRVRPALLILLGAVGLVLLIAGANVANLLLARAAGRRAETAIRTALGASRWRLIRELLTECLLLSLLGGLAGVLLAAQGVSWVKRLNIGNLPRVEELGIDLWVLGFTFLISLLTGLVFGLVPALQSSRGELTEALKVSRKGAAGGVQHRRWLNSLVVAEIALALVLLVGAGLLLRSFRLISAVDPGFNPHNVLTLSVPLPPANYPDQQKQAQFYENALAKLNAVPGVQAAAAVFRIPVVGLATAIFTIEGKPIPFGNEPNADYRTISPNYFRTIGIQLRRGREFNERDAADAPDVVIINEELARRFFPGEDPLGKRLQIATERTRFREIVGVVGNARLTSLEGKVDPAIYVPLAQNSWPHALRTSYFVLRTEVLPRHLLASIRDNLHSLDPALPVTQVQTMEEILANSLATRRFNMTLLLVFAGVAGLLALVGIYGVMSYTVTQRTHELGVRMALGARPTDVLKMVIIDGAKLTLIGVVVGLACSFALTRLMAQLLYGVSASDPLTFAVIALLLTIVAMLAGVIPARRAAQVNPVLALRGE